MRILLILLIFELSTFLFSIEPVTGIWKSYSHETGLINTITLIYQYNNSIYGRLLVTYNDGRLGDPSSRAEKILNEPTYVGLDYIWGLVEKGNKWVNGKIMDPQKGLIYSCDMWRNGKTLIVKGKVGPFGKELEWLPVTNLNELPSWVDLNPTPIPNIPSLK